MDKKKEEISLHTKEVEQIIEKYLPKEEGFQKKVIEAMNPTAAAKARSWS